MHDFFSICAEDYAETGKCQQKSQLNVTALALCIASYRELCIMLRILTLYINVYLFAVIYECKNYVMCCT